MPARSLTLSLSLLFLLPFLPANAQDALPRGIPEKEGVQSTAIIDFINAANHGRTEFHSFMFLRHGKVIAEGWWNPYGPNLKHTLYSTSKSFTAAAVGFALAEKKLKLDDKVVSFFPNELPNPISSYLEELTVKDALMMSDGMDPDPTGKVTSDTNWARAFLALPIVNEPGTKFLYNSTGTYMLSAIVQKVTGQKVIDYLRPRLFEPLGIFGEDWEISPQGVNTGGWGLRLRTEDMAKFGQLYLQDGVWKGKRILSKEWVKEATTMKIMQNPKASPAAMDSSDWLQGYCYQMWRCRHNAYRADGAFGQFIIIMPDQDAVVAIQAETPSMQEEINLVWQYLLPGMQNWAYKDDPDDDTRLQKLEASLALPPKQGAGSAADFDINGKTYTLNDNPKKWRSVRFTIQGRTWQMTVKTDSGSYTIPFGDGQWALSQTNLSGPNLLTGAQFHDVGLSDFKTGGNYHWRDENTLELTLRYIESPHTETLVCHFDGKQVDVDCLNSYQYGQKPTVLHGTAQ
jgi:CubicO group peptidase (beta-lactamase class C family)